MITGRLTATVGVELLTEDLIDFSRRVDSPDSGLFVFIQTLTGSTSLVVIVSGPSGFALWTDPQNPYVYP